MVASQRVRARRSLNSRAASGPAGGGKAPGVSRGPLQDGISAGLLSATG